MIDSVFMENGPMGFEIAVKGMSWEQAYDVISGIKVAGRQKYSHILIPEVEGVDALLVLRFGPNNEWSPVTYMPGQVALQVALYGDTMPPFSSLSNEDYDTRIHAALTPYGTNRGLYSEDSDMLRQESKLILDSIQRKLELAGVKGCVTGFCDGLQRDGDRLRQINPVDLMYANKRNQAYGN